MEAEGDFGVDFLARINDELSLVVRGCDMVDPFNPKPDSIEIRITPNAGILLETTVIGTESRTYENEVASVPCNLGLVTCNR